MTAEFQARGIRVSIFVDPVAEMVAGAKECGADRVGCTPRPMPGISPPGANGRSSLMSGQRRRLAVAVWGLNAGHDLNLENLCYFVERIPWTDEVSIGHALICDALYYGLENTVRLYRRELAF